ncbi:MAG: DNA polymerase III subunit delta' [Gammaproteobacteria bacterium RIFCSPHIGHO2_12_FULL_37_34]|nr:MAG: DNA polymerase III subunit delta' [Gammaproteobacteria bacterium RIFCSPHIGHO2_12_FULL_37_34]
MIYAWQQKQWQQLWRMKCDNRLPHALLLSGLLGIGKTQFADHIAQTILCEQNNHVSQQESCNRCHACHLVMTNVHPDVLRVEPVQADGAIVIDQIREVSDFINQSSLQGKNKIVIIRFADQMNLYAAHALLKTLEEPSPGSLILLISHQNERLLATIRSRCQLLTFPRPPQEQALQWLCAQLKDKDNNIRPEWLLEIAHGAPLAALKLLTGNLLSLRQQIFEAFYLSDDPLHRAAMMQDQHALQIVDFCLSWITDLLRLQLSGETNIIINKDYTKQLIELRKSTVVSHNTALMLYLLELRKRLCQGVHFNKQLMVESVFIRWKMGQRSS